MHGTTMNSIPREIAKVEALLAYLDGCSSLRGTVLQGLDLRAHGDRLLASELTIRAGAVERAWRVRK